MLDNMYNLFPEIEPYHSGWLAAGEHEIYYEQCGNPSGQPVVFLHGGPGSGCNATQRRFFDAAHYRIILLDQRGCGRSKPLGCIENNTIDHLVSDLELLRCQLNIERWMVFGGSWGSTLALAYASAHTNRVQALILRGIFLSRAGELAWFLNDVQQFFPEAHDKLTAYLPESERNDVLLAYKARIFSEESPLNAIAAARWNAFESSIMSLNPAKTAPPSAAVAASTSPVSDAIQVARAKVQIHYIVNACFVGHRSLLAEARAINHIPTVIVQGRYDMVCPPISAWQLKEAMPDASLTMVADAGHSAMEPGITSALVAATESFKSL